jgi:hypothetical protein
MRKFIALVAAAIVALAIAAASASAGNPNTLTVAVYGDSPYGTSNTDTAEFAATPAFIASVNNDADVQEIVHVGDIHSGSQKCTVAYDQSIYDLWAAYRNPLVYTPGDNEWSDCTKPKELPGSDFAADPQMPLTQLGEIRSIFFAHPGQTLGQNPIRVTSQAHAFDRAHPDDAQFTENVMWRQSKTMFVTVNIPGGSNNDIDPWFSQATPNAAQPLEMAERTAADVRWLRAAFAKAEEDDAHSVVIVGQADMWDTSDAPAHQANYEPIIAAMASDARRYGKPVLYLNGDSHVYRSDDPLQQGSTCYTESGACSGDAWNQHPHYDVPNFHRIVVHGSTFPLEWLKLTIDPRSARRNNSTPTSWGPFSWQRQIQA